VLPQLLDQRRQFSPTMPGENTGPADGPYIGYLKALRDWDRRFPGFGHEAHGVELRGGEHHLQCVKTEA
jgi:arginine/lysine/ornithine decarboxylase